ncbi:MAG: 4a-hydroxytetrahydrobiopterin dehydratase [Gammaproteobacteria bacterium]
MNQLSSADIASRLATLNSQSTVAWRLADNGLEKTWVFPDFAAAFAFMTRVAAEAELMNHHPDWRNVWNKVEVRLSTHDAGGITGLDFRLAAAMDRLA